LYGYVRNQIEEKITIPQINLMGMAVQKCNITWPFTIIAAYFKKGATIRGILLPA
jgi:hypothetical protein